jgi:Flp pilus assembly CpaF family ATPase
MLRAENAEVLIHPSDRKYGALLVGGQGTGKTSALLSFYLNDIEDRTRRRS